MAETGLCGRKKGTEGMRGIGTCAEWIRAIGPELGWFRERVFTLVVCLAGCHGSFLEGSAFGDYPTPLWWTSRGVLKSEVSVNDFGPVNLGQLKHTAVNAAEELDARLSDGAGGGIWGALQGWAERSENANDFAMANVGQLKAVASLFHRRLQEQEYGWGPWSRALTQAAANDYAPANLGQLKALFAFDLTADFDGDGLPDWWEFQRLSPYQNRNPEQADYAQTVALFEGAEDPDGDGLTNLEELVQRRDPADYYNGELPILRLVSGDAQLQPVGTSLGAPLVIEVTDREGRPLENAPVRLWVNEGDISLGGLAAWEDALASVRTDENGMVSVMVRLGEKAGSISVSPVGGRRFAEEGSTHRSFLNAVYHGKPRIKLLGSGQWTGDDPEQLEVQRVGVQLLDSSGMHPISGQRLEVHVVTGGDAEIEQEGEQGDPLQTDDEGCSHVLVRRGTAFSFVEFQVDGWRARIGVDQKISGAIDILGSSVETDDESFPANGIPVIWLSRAIPEDVWIDPVSGQWKGGTWVRGVTGARSEGGFCATLQRPIQNLSTGVEVQEIVCPVTGQWVILPGRKAVAFKPEMPFWRYQSYAPPNPLGMTRWPQDRLRFSISLLQSDFPFRIARPYERSFEIRDTEDFRNRLSALSELTARFEAKVSRAQDSFVLQEPLEAQAILPENESEGVDVGVPIWVQFNEALDPSCFETASIWLESAVENVNCRAEFDYFTNSLWVIPDRDLAFNTRYRLQGLRELRSLSGQVSEQLSEYGFRTASVRCVEGEELFWESEPLLDVPLRVMVLNGSMVVRGGKGVDGQMLERVEATLVPVRDPEVPVAVLVSVNPLTQRLTISPEETLEAGVLYRLRLRIPAQSNEAIVGVNSKSDAQDGPVSSASALVEKEILILGERTVKPPAQGTDKSIAAAAFGTSRGKVPSKRISSASGSSYDGGVVDAKTPEGCFRFPFSFGAAVRHICDRSTTRLQLEYKDLQGAVTAEDLDGVFLENGGVPQNVVSRPIPYGSVIRMRAVGGSGGESGDINKKPLISIGRADEGSEVLRNYRPPTANCHYISFERSAARSDVYFSVHHIDGMDPTFEVGSRGLMHRKGSISIGGSNLEVLWCPVVVRDEFESPMRSDDELVLSTKRGILEYGPKSLEKEGELKASFEKRLKAYYGLPYPRQAMAWMSLSGDAVMGTEREVYNDPAMPHLTACVREAPPEVMGCWRLRVRYDRGNGRGERSVDSPGILHPRTQPEDIVDIPGRPNGDVFPFDVALPKSRRPTTGSRLESVWRGNVPGYTDWMPACEEWRIFETPEWKNEIRARGMFGGEATLYWCPKNEYSEEAAREGRWRGMERVVARFRIGGTNPANAMAKAWMEGRGYYDEENVPWFGKDASGAEGRLWYAYAIAKGETAEYRYAEPGSSSPFFYNQFRSNPKRADCCYPTWNNDGADKPGGYGIFQVTGNMQSEQASIPRRQIWNWKENVKAGAEILRGKWRLSENSMRNHRQTAGSAAIPTLNVRGVIFAENTGHTILDAVTMKRYNGVSRPNPVDKIDMGDDGSGFVQGFAVSEAEMAEFCYRSAKRNLWCLCRFNGFVEVKELADKTKLRIYRGFNYVDRVCQEVELDGSSGGGFAGR